MDVHRKRSQVAICDQAGHIQRNHNVPNDPAELVSLLGALPAGTPVALEAADGWGWLVGLLDALKLEAHLVHPARCKAIASARLKNDKVDAETLAQPLRAALLPEAWTWAAARPRPARAATPPGQPGAADHQPGRTGSTRCSPDRGVPAPGSPWTRPGRAWLAALELPPVPRGIVADCGGLIDTLACPISRLERPLSRLAKPDPRVAALMALPGIGRLTASEAAGRDRRHPPLPIGPQTVRLGRAAAGGAQLATARSATGTAPSRAPHGRAGMLQEAAQRARTSPPFAGVYARIAHRRGKQVATVAVARRLLARSFHILKQLEAAPEPEKVTTGRARVLRMSLPTRPLG